jgi:hypothetical protein
MFSVILAWLLPQLDMNNWSCYCIVCHKQTQARQAIIAERLNLKRRLTVMTHQFRS